MRTQAPPAELPEELWRVAFEANPTMYFIVDEAGAIVSVNRFGAQQLGYEVGELVGQPVLNVFCEPDRPYVQDNAKRCFAHPGRTMRWEARKVRKDGQVIWVRETANAVTLRDRPVLLVACEDVTERKRAEEALRDSEERFRTLVEFSFDVYWETDAQHRFVRQEFSPTVASTLQPELGKTRWEVPYVEPDEEAWRRHRETLDAHLPFRDFELARPTPDGGTRYVSVCGLPVFDDTGAFTGYRGVGRHINERKRAEEMLRASELRHRRIFQEANVSIWELDFSRIQAAIDELRQCGVSDFRGYIAAHPEFVRRAISVLGICDVNDATLRLFGAKTKEDLMVSLADLFVPETEAIFAEELVALADGRHSFQGETAMLTVDGERLSVLFTVAFPPRGATSASALVSIMDITERRRAQQLNRHVFESAPDGMGIIGRDYRYQRVNPVYESNWNMPAERIVGLHARDLFGSEVFEQTLKARLDRCFAGEQVSFADWFTNVRGRFYYSVIYAPLRLDSEQVDAALAITRDLTDHMLASEALREAEAALARVNRVTTLGVLAASIAHEVNQPLGAMTMSAAACARWLAAEPPDMAKARSALQRITADGRRAGQVVDRIRALVNRQAPRRNRVDLNEAILEVIALTRDEMRRNGVALRTSLASDLPAIEADRVQIQQVALNLLVNAIEAMSANGTRVRELAIASARDGANAVAVEVRDSGPGVGPCQLDRLFEAFFTTKDEGIGMGLSISRSIIEAHGGRLWVTPNEPHGAAFRFSLPVRQAVT